MVALLVSMLALPAYSGVLGPWPEDDPLEIEIEPSLPETTLAAVDPPRCRSNLPDGMQLPDLPELYRLNDADRAWGTSYLVETIVTVAEDMAFLVPDADPIYIGDLSKRGGGALGGHRSHNAGLDADIGLYSTGHRQPIGGGFEELAPSELDHESTWMLIKSLLDTGRVEFILLDQSLIRSLRVWLLDNAVLTRAEVDRIFPPPNTPRLWEMQGYVRHAEDHRDHMHLRVRCAQ